MVDIGRVNELLAEVRKNRRPPTPDYPAMHSAADEILRLLYGEKGAEAYRTQAAVLYELGMAELQQGRLCASLALHNESARLARLGNSAVGELFCNQNIGGLILPCLGLWEEGAVMHHKTLRRIETLLLISSGEEEQHLYRIQMNCWAQLIRHQVVNDRGDPGQIAALCNSLEANPVFRAQYKDSDPTGPGPARDLKAGRDYIAAHEA